MTADFNTSAQFWDRRADKLGVRKGTRLSTELEGGDPYMAFICKLL